MHIALKPWELSDAASLMSLCNRVDRSFLSDRFPLPTRKIPPKNGCIWLATVRK